MGDLQTNSVLPSLQVQFEWVGDLQTCMLGQRGWGTYKQIQFTTLHAGSIGTGVCDYLACWVRTGWGTE